jgi:hypothetical protein
LPVEAVSDEAAGTIGGAADKIAQMHFQVPDYEAFRSGNHDRKAAAPVLVFS